MAKYSNSLTSKLPKVGTSIFAVMSQLAEEHNALNLSQGFPNFGCSSKLIDLVTKYMKLGFNQYAPMPGILKLREAIAMKTYESYSVNYNPISEITLTAGATQAIYTAVSAFIREGDEVIVFEPAYDSYVPAIQLNGGIPIFIQMKTPEYKIDWDEVQKMIGQKTKMIIINSPHNPTGSILNSEDLRKLEKLTKNSDIIIISDEVYEHIIFEKLEHQSVCRYPKLVERSLVISSFGKTFHTTGWKMGYVLAPENLTVEFRKAHQFTVFSCNTPIQHAYTDFLQDKSNFNGVSDFYQEKRDYFIKLIKPSKFKIIPSYGTYFQLLDYSKISEEKEMDFAAKLVKENGIAAIPVSSFYHKPCENKILRFCFAKNNETLEKAAEILCKI